MRGLLFLILGLALVPVLRADVIYDGGTSSGATSTDANFINNLFPRQAQSIFNPFVSAQQGTRIDTISFYLFKRIGQTVDGDLKIKLYNDTGSSGAYVPSGSALYSFDWLTQSQADSLIPGNDISDPTNNYVGTLLTANLTSQNWILQGGKRYIYSLEYSGFEEIYFNYEMNGAPGSENASYYDAALAQWLGDTGKNMAGSVTGTTVAVPEPSTFALGLLAAASGCGGWWVRKKNARKVVAVA